MCNVVSDIRKSSRAFVRSDHEIGVIAVIAQDLRRWGNDVALTIVGKVEHAPDKGLVAPDHLVGPVGRLAVGEFSNNKAAFGSHWNNNGIFDNLGFYQTQDFGSKILRPVRPAKPATGYPSASQVDGLQMRGENKYFEEGSRLGHSGNRSAIDLKGQPFRLIGVVFLKIVGSDQRIQQVDIG